MRGARSKESRLRIARLASKDEVSDRELIQENEKLQTCSSVDLLDGWFPHVGAEDLEVPRGEQGVQLAVLHRPRDQLALAWTGRRDTLDYNDMLEVLVACSRLQRAQLGDEVRMVEVKTGVREELERQQEVSFRETNATKRLADLDPAFPVAADHPEAVPSNQRDVLGQGEDCEDLVHRISRAVLVLFVAVDDTVGSDLTSQRRKTKMGENGPTR